MSYCTSRSEDWKRFCLAWNWLWRDVRDCVRFKRCSKAEVWEDIKLIGHTGKNIVVEELRRWGLKVRGKRCE